MLAARLLVVAAPPVPTYGAVDTAADNLTTALTTLATARAYDETARATAMDAQAVMREVIAEWADHDLAGPRPTGAGS